MRMMRIEGGRAGGCRAHGLVCARRQCGVRRWATRNNGAVSHERLKERAWCALSLSPFFHLEKLLHGRHL